MQRLGSGKCRRVAGRKQQAEQANRPSRRNKEGERRQASWGWGAQQISNQYSTIQLKHLKYRGMIHSRDRTLYLVSCILYLISCVDEASEVTCLTMILHSMLMIRRGRHHCYTTLLLYYSTTLPLYFFLLSSSSSSSFFFPSLPRPCSLLPLASFLFLFPALKQICISQLALSRPAFPYSINPSLRCLISRLSFWSSFAPR